MNGDGGGQFLATAPVDGGVVDQIHRALGMWAKASEECERNGMDTLSLSGRPGLDAIWAIASTAGRLYRCHATGGSRQFEPRRQVVGCCTATEDADERDWSRNASQDAMLRAKNIPGGGNQFVERRWVL